MDAARDERIEEAAAALGGELQAARLGLLVRVVEREADELGHRDALVARDPERGQRGGAAAGGGGDVDHVGALSEVDVLVKLLPLTWARWPWTLTRAPGGLTVPLTCVVELWTMAVSDGAETLSCTGFCGLGGGVSAPHPQGGCRR